MKLPKTKNLEKLARIWYQPGVNPAYHRKIKSRLYFQWPLLYFAILKLVKPYRDKTTKN